MGAQPGAGDIPITLDGKEYVLRPSLEACIKISEMAGGLNGAIQRCAALRFDTISEVVAAGLNANPTQMKQVREAIYREGLISVHSHCIEFIHVIGRGGKPLDDGEDGDESDEDPPQPA